jgi:hypothetical protein
MPVADKQLLKRIDGLAGRGAACTGPRPSRRRRRGGPVTHNRACTASSRGLAAPAGKTPAAALVNASIHSRDAVSCAASQDRHAWTSYEFLQVWRRCRVFRKGRRGGISGDVPDLQNCQAEAPTLEIGTSTLGRPAILVGCGFWPSADQSPPKHIPANDHYDGLCVSKTRQRLRLVMRTSLRGAVLPLASEAQV